MNKPVTNTVEGKHAYPAWYKYFAVAMAIFTGAVAIERLIQQDLFYGGLCGLMVLVFSLGWYSVTKEGVVVESDRITELNPWGENKTVRYEDVRRAWYSPRSFRFSDGTIEVTVMTGFQNAIEVASFVRERLPENVVHEGSDEMKHKVELGRDYTSQEYARTSAGLFLVLGVAALSLAFVSMYYIWQDNSSIDLWGGLVLFSIPVVPGVFLTYMGVWGYYQRWWGNEN